MGFTEHKVDRWSCCIKENPKCNGQRLPLADIVLFRFFLSGFLLKFLKRVCYGEVSAPLQKKCFFTHFDRCRISQSTRLTILGLAFYELWAYIKPILNLTLWTRAHVWIQNLKKSSTETNEASFKNTRKRDPKASSPSFSLNYVSGLKFSDYQRVYLLAIGCVRPYPYHNFLFLFWFWLVYGYFHMFDLVGFWFLLWWSRF